PRSAAEESRVDFRADVFGGGNVTYQWFKDGAALAGATNQTLTLPFVHPPDAGNYSFSATGPSNSVLSSEAALTIIPDRTLPRLVASFITNDFSTIAIVLSEPIDPQSATNVANYVFSPAITVLSAEAVGPNM